MHQDTKSSRIHIRIPNKQRELLERMAEEEGRTLSDMIRRLLPETEHSTPGHGSDGTSSVSQSVNGNNGTGAGAGNLPHGKAE